MPFVQVYKKKDDLYEKVYLY